MDKVGWKRQIDHMREALVGMGWLLYELPGEEDRVCFEEQAVYINSRNWPETRFYTILHELGHIMVWANSHRFRAVVPMYVHSPDVSTDGRTERGKAYRVSLIAEEIEAWKIGRKFAVAQGLWVDRKKYDKHMTEAVMTYIDWAANE